MGERKIATIDGRGPHRVLIRADASPTIGGGHAMRCFALANLLAERGAKVTFVAAAMSDLLEKRIVAAGHQLERIASSPEMSRNGEKWEEPPLSVQEQMADARATAAVIGRADWAIVDHYLLDANWHAAARGFAGRIMVIDDLANRSYDCDLLLDQTFSRTAEAYRDRVPDEARVLSGSIYSLLRPEFVRERPRALDRRETAEPVRRILISMGTADPAGVTMGVVQQVIEAAPNCSIDIVLGAEAPNLQTISDAAALHADATVHVDSESMARLIGQADIAIGAAGTTNWERCCLGVPAIVLVVAENQREAAANLGRAGAVHVAEAPTQIAELVRSLAANGRMRMLMSAAAAAVTDGLGCERAFKAMVGTDGAAGQVLFRHARPEDSRSVWLWRNDFVTRKYSQTTEPIAWQDHVLWWEKTLQSDERLLLIAETDGQPVAALRFDRLGVDEVEVSINLAPFARGAGIGRRVLSQGCRNFQSRDGSSVLATIHRDNEASRRVFESVGFVRSRDLSEFQFERYVLAGGAPD